ncbi:hypothetical protein CAPTEDRAFT_196453 [Capitella teleta]|uniref:G-protein coupled receptors family 1 profile domain-containing protein n=1 Tax=Capitella teleta TaxID=283909 RepID=R7V1Q9_CAPTE|nr:hypothetical protein CAPTEDRAFT_196453 [Capitella teleta]|eukprot:ELU12442.1 hypothetical protein CAPTEDRAFT_196453 [Capitella teleta]
MDTNASGLKPCDHHEDPSQDETLAAFSFIVNVLVVGFVSVLGVICNVLSVITLQLDRHKLSMSVLLQGLAVTDIVFLCYSFVYTCLRSVFPYSGRVQSIYAASKHIVAYLLPIGWMAQTSAIWIVVLVSLDRFIAVCLPFRANRLCTIRHSRIAVVVVWVSSAIFNLPRFFYYHQQSFGSHTTSNSTFVAHLPLNSAFWSRYRTIYHIYMTMTFLFIIPLPVLVILNVKLMREIAEAKKRQLQLTGTKAERDTISVTVNLIAVVTVFILCETPDFIASVITLEDFCFDKLAIEYFLCIKEALLVMGASTNFFIYCLFYNSFRRLICRLLCQPFILLDDVASNVDREKASRSNYSPPMTARRHRLTENLMPDSHTSVI